MPQQKLTIVPVTLHPDNKIHFSSPAANPASIICTIKTANLEISFFNGVDEHVIRLLEEQLAHSNQQNKDLSKQIEALTEPVRQLTKLLYGSKTEKSRYQTADGQASLFDDDSSFNLSEPREEQSQQTETYTVVRKIRTKKRNNSLREDVETEMIHPHPEITLCDCCHHQMVEIGSTLAREEAAFIPAKMMRVPRDNINSRILAKKSNGIRLFMMRTKYILALSEDFLIQPL